jgi:hypothetical protein
MEREARGLRPEVSRAMCHVPRVKLKADERKTCNLQLVTCNQ